MALVDLEAPVILPFPNCKPQLGIDETVITRDDMTSFRAWNWLANRRLGRAQSLGEQDFKDKDLFYKYFLLSTGLLEFPAVLICGPRGAGKSLIASFLTYQGHRLFGKNVTMEKPPPQPDLFGKIHYLHDQDYVDSIILDLARLDKIEAETGKRPSEEELLKCILYKTIMWLDEAHMWGDKIRTFNLTVLINRILMVARHLHLDMYFNYVSLKRVHPLIYDFHTHIINCGKDWFRPGWCSFEIIDRRPGGTNSVKFIHLYPPDWLDIWDSYNIPSVVRDVEIHLGGNKKNKPKAPQFDLQAAADEIRLRKK